MKIGVFSLTCCEGCSVQFLNIESDILKLVEKFDIKNFRLIKERNEMPVDIAFVEGFPSNDEEVEKLSYIRENSKILVSMGACASNAGIPGMVNYAGKKAKGIKEYVDVDYFLYGCPFSIDELMELISCIFHGKEFRNKNQNVCSECYLRGVDCLLDKHILCMGGVARAGCNAVCPYNGHECSACRGGYEGIDIKSHARLLLSKGFSEEEIIDAYEMYMHEYVEELKKWLKER
ncbi:MAG: NADH:ubiquinone oxidoreductase [Thermoplasmata archaeon]|nr:NADH:ubiquinone oxidoreductase [Thermoplasmata archaeon]